MIQLITIAPNAPFPLGLLENVIAANSIVGGPTKLVIDNVFVAPFFLTASIDSPEIARQIKQDMTRDTITITASNQDQLRTLFAQLPLTPQAKWRQSTQLDNMRSGLIFDMYDAASFLPDADSDFSHDQLALMVPHLIHMIPLEVAQAQGDWAPIQAMTVLWLLNDHGVVAEAALAEQTHILIKYAETWYESWDEWPIASTLLQTVEEMINAKWEGVPTSGVQILDMAEVVLNAIEDEDDEAYRAKSLKEIEEFRQTIANWQQGE